MIHYARDQAYVQTVDGDIYSWVVSKQVEPARADTGGINGSCTLVASIPSIDSVIIRGNGDQIYIYSASPLKCRNITTFICGTFGAMPDQLSTEIVTTSVGFIMWVGSKLCFFTFVSNFNDDYIDFSDMYTQTESFGGDIDMVTSAWNYIIVRTAENGLFFFGDISGKGIQKFPIDFHDVANIKQIERGTYYVLLLTEEGRVYQYDLSTHKITGNSKKSFPEDVHVTKIISAQGYIVYLTDRGSIYYAIEAGPFRINSAPALDELIIDDVFILEIGLALVHDGGQLTMIYSWQDGRDFSIYGVCQMLRTNKKPTPILFPGAAISVTLVSQYKDFVHVITTSGQVYQIKLKQERKQAVWQISRVLDMYQLQSISCFDTNPVSSRETIRLIPSALSVLGQN